MIKVVHIIPYDGVGGVESVARTMSLKNKEGIEFVVDFIFKNVDVSKRRWNTFNLLLILSAAWRISLKDVDILIVSLWRSAIVGLIVKILRPKLKLVVFLHLPVDVHIFDYFFNRLAILFSSEVWVDSNATLLGRVPKNRTETCKVISFVSRHFDELPEITVNPSFIFWGRITQQKRLDRAIEIFAKIHNIYPQARFLVIGPDGGALKSIKNLCKSIGIENAVFFFGTATHNQIIQLAKNVSFFIQTSDIEGMSMSVVESMQLGLVPIVTPVGEIAFYCKHNENSVIVSSEEKTHENILNLISNNDNYQRLRVNAIDTWKNSILYRDSVLLACEKLMNKL